VTSVVIGRIYAIHAMRPDDWKIKREARALRAPLAYVPDCNVMREVHTERDGAGKALYRSALIQTTMMVHGCSMRRPLIPLKSYTVRTATAARVHTAAGGMAPSVDQDDELKRPKSTEASERDGSDRRLSRCQSA